MFIVFLITGTGLLVYGIIMLAVRIKFIPMSQATTGTVIDLYRSYSRGGAKYYPIIEYYNSETGSMERFQHNIGGTHLKYNIGDRMEIRYYSDGDRKLALVNTWTGIWLTPIVCILMGALFCVFGIFMKSK